MAATPDLASIVRLMGDDPFARGARPVARRLHQLIDALDVERARYALVGAVAMAAHGVRRFTEDIDALVDAADLPRVVARAAPRFREVGREPAAGAPLQVKLRPCRGHAVDVDLMAPVDAAEQWALASAVRGRAHGRRVDVASAEALIVLKLRAYLSDPDSEDGAKHRADALALARRARVDVAALRRFVADSPALRDEVERALAAPAPRGRLAR